MFCYAAVGHRCSWQCKHNLLTTAAGIVGSGDSKIVTDDFASYRGIEKKFAGGHGTVTHSIEDTYVAAIIGADGKRVMYKQPCA